MKDTEVKEVARNEPCPCGSGKKYKRCHGVDAAPKLGAPKALAEGGGLPQGFDPNSIDPQWLAQFSQMMNRLPKGQLNRMQALMQKAMSGKDISQESQGFEEQLPVELQKMLLDSPWAGELKKAQDAQAAAPVEPKEPSKLKKFFSKLKG